MSGPVSCRRCLTPSNVTKEGAVVEITLTHRHLALAAVLAIPVGLFASQAVPQTPPRPTGLKPPAAAAPVPADPMLARFARLSPANISDAMDQVGGGRGFLD